jgi:hypothetical protein
MGNCLVFPRGFLEMVWQARGFLKWRENCDLLESPIKPGGNKKRFLQVLIQSIKTAFPSTPNNSTNNNNFHFLIIYSLIISIKIQLINYQ